jgi:hypothetical protein
MKTMTKVNEEMVLAIEFFTKNGYNASPKNIKCSPNTEVVWDCAPVSGDEELEFTVSIHVMLYGKKAVSFIVQDKKLTGVKWNEEFWSDPLNNSNTVKSRVKALNSRFCEVYGWTR